MGATLRGIYHNLTESTYTVSNGEIILFFSSTVYRAKFLEGYKNERQKFRDRTKLSLEDEVLNMDALSDINYYKRIEKRGFYAWLKGVNISWQEIHRYVLRKMTEKSSLDWFQIQKPKLEERLKIME